MAKITRNRKSEVTIIKKRKIHWLMIINFLMCLYVIGHIHKDKLESIISTFK